MGRLTDRSIHCIEVWLQRHESQFIVRFDGFHHVSFLTENSGNGAVLDFPVLFRMLAASLKFTRFPHTIM